MSYLTSQLRLLKKASRKEKEEMIKLLSKNKYKKIYELIKENRHGDEADVLEEYEKLVFAES